MVGTKYASEKRVFTDIKSGARITQLTNRGINFHFYFTENSFDLDGETIFFYPIVGMKKQKYSTCSK